MIFLHSLFLERLIAFKTQCQFSEWYSRATIAPRSIAFAFDRFERYCARPRKPFRFDYIVASMSISRLSLETGITYESAVVVRGFCARAEPRFPHFFILQASFEWCKKHWGKILQKCRTERGLVRNETFEKKILAQYISAIRHVPRINLS